MTPNEEMPTHSRKPLPAVYDAALEFHLLAREWLRAARAPHSEVAPVHRATRRSCVAIFLAAHGPKHHLRRAKEAMLTCLGHLPILCAEGTISEAVCREGERRIDQIIAGLDQLRGAPPEKWAELPLPALAAAGPSDGGASAKRIEAIFNRVVQAVQLHAVAEGKASAAKSGMTLHRPNGERRKQTV